MVLVSLVILAFLGSLRTMAIPAVTIPVCLVSAFIALAAFGFTVNLITLLALVLSIGLVVDDAIVVLENIHRRIEEGEPPLLAAYNGSRQVAFAVIATTAVLVAVFTPNHVSHRQHRRHLRRTGRDHRCGGGVLQRPGAVADTGNVRPSCCASPPARTSSPAASIGASRRSVAAMPRCCECSFGTVGGR